MDKLTIGFVADILYLKGIIGFEEFQDILNAKEPSDLQSIVDKLIGGKYNAYKRGEGYVLDVIGD